MTFTTDPEIFDQETGLYVQVVRNSETGEVVGKNERAPFVEPASNPSKESARAKLAALGLTDEEISAIVGG